MMEMLLIYSFSILDLFKYSDNIILHNVVEFTHYINYFKDLSSVLLKTGMST